MIRVTIWNEFRHERQDEAVKAVYPNGIHAALAAFLQTDPELQVRTATLDEPENGLPEAVLEQTDVLIWWGHMAHEEVDDATVGRVCSHVLHGMGLIALHSAHKSKVFMRLMGTTCNLCSREHMKENSRIWVVTPSHPIVRGIGQWIDLEHEEMYGEPFDVPEPETLVLLSWFKGGEVFRSGCTYRRGGGKIFYFQPGHETFPTYYHPQIQQILKNAVHWVRSDVYHGNDTCPYIAEPLEVL